MTLSDLAEGDPGTSTTLRRHLRAQPARAEGGQSDGRADSPAARRAPVAMGTDQEGDGETSLAPQRSPRGPAVLLRRRRGRGLDERTGALHDVRGEGQGKVRGHGGGGGGGVWKEEEILWLINTLNRASKFTHAMNLSWCFGA